MTCSSAPVSFARNWSAMALATSLSTERMSVSLRSKVSAQRWESLVALISCTFTRTISPLFCTFPSCSFSKTRRLQLFRRCRVPELRSVQIHQGEANAMFDFTLAKFMQVRLPVRVFLKIFSDVLRQQNVSGITAVHDPLCRVDAGASHVRFSGCVDDTAYGSTVYPHPQLKFRMLLEGAAYFQSAFNRRFRAMVKNQRDAVACRDCDQSA